MPLNVDEFALYYQPFSGYENFKYKICGGIDTMDTSHKWIVSPLNFIPIAEDTGLIYAIGEMVFRMACLQHNEWVKQGLPKMKIAVNISARQFRHNNLLSMIESIVKETKMDPTYLEIEITESFAMNNIEYVIHILNELKKMGMSIAVDDFGTGYSSINYLKSLPIDSLKIDKSFIEDIESSNAQREIIRALISLSHGIDLKVTAEGVETIEQMEFLQEHNCDKLQGFLFAKPVPPEKLIELFNMDMNKTIKGTHFE